MQDRVALEVISQVTAFKTCYPKISHLGILNFSSWRKWLRNGICGNEQVIKSSCDKYPSYTQRKGTSLSLKSRGHREESEWAGLVKFPHLQHLAHILCPILLFHNFPLFFKPTIKTQVSPFTWVFISLWSLLHRVKLILNKCVCFSPINLPLADYLAV